MLTRCGEATLAAGFLLLCRCAAVLRSIGGVGDARGALLAHPLVLQRLVLLFVLNVRAGAGHADHLRSHRCRPVRIDWPWYDLLYPVRTPKRRFAAQCGGYPFGG